MQVELAALNLAWARHGVTPQSLLFRYGWYQA